MTRKEILEFEQNFSYRNRVRKKNIYIIVYEGMKKMYEDRMKALDLLKFVDSLPLYDPSKHDLNLN